MVNPHCDIATGKIYGCKKNSFEWFHEKGHLIYNESDKGSQNILWARNVFVFWIFITSCAFFLESFKYFSLILASQYVGLELYEEYWCNKYAKEQLKKRGDYEEKQRGSLKTNL
jgi:hypothetical protein